MHDILLNVLFVIWAPLLILVGIALWLGVFVVLGVEIFDTFKTPNSRQSDEEDPFEERFNL